jgi:spore germination protein YaaH
MATDPGTRRTTGRRAALAALVAGVALALGASALPADAASSTPQPRRMVSGWLPYWTTSSSLATVLANADVFGDVSPFWYSASGNSPNIGLQAQISSSTAASVTAQLQAKGIKVLPTVTDGSGRLDMTTQLSSPAGRRHMVAVLTNLVTSKGYDGIDLDWEGFAFSDGQSTWATTRGRWDAFVALLASSLHAKHKILALTVPGGLPTARDSTSYWVYDWSFIGRQADRVRIMAYDYSVSSAGPIAPLPWVTAVVKQAVTQIPSTKVQIGIASYGRDWLTAVSGRCPNVAPSSATSSDFFSNLSWARKRHEFDSRIASSYVSSLFVNASSTVAGITRVKAPVATWNATNAERTFSYQLGFAGTYQTPSVSVAPVGGFAGASAVIVSPVAGLKVGSRVTGTGVGAGATIVSVAGNIVTLSAKNTAHPVGPLTVTSSATTTGKAAKGATALTVGSAAGADVGTAVSGTGIAAGTTVKAVSGTVLTLDRATTAAVSGNVVLTTVRGTTAVGGVGGTSAVQVASTAGIVVGALVTGTGVGAGAKVSSVNGHTVTLSVANTGSVYRGLASKSPASAASCTISRTGWYSDAASANARAKLVGTYKLAGIAEWTIGGEDAGQWPGLRSYAASIAPDATGTVVGAPRSMRFGARGAVTATVRAAGAVKPGVNVRFYFLPLGSKTWALKGSAVTGADGVARFTTPPTRGSGTWRAYTPSTWGTLASSANASAATLVVPVVSGAPASATVKRKAALSLRAYVYPTSQGAPVLVQRHTSAGWVTVATIRMSASLRAYFHVPTASRGSFTYRFVVAATATHLAGSSKPIVVRIT